MSKTCTRDFSSITTTLARIILLCEAMLLITYTARCPSFAWNLLATILTGVCHSKLAISIRIHYFQGNSSEQTFLYGRKYWSAMKVLEQL